MGFFSSSCSLFRGSLFFPGGFAEKQAVGEGSFLRSLAGSGKGSILQGEMRIKKKP
jgi:hypothetical protein